MADYHVRRSIGEHILRSFVLVAALFIMSLGIALSAKASLGVSPISCTPYVLSLALPLSMGTITILMHLSFVAVQAALLKRQFRPVHLLQIPVVFVFGMLTDFSMWLVSPLEPAGYAWSAVICLLSCVILGFGVFMQVKADAVLLAAEGMNLAFVKLFKWEFGAVKTGMDCTLVCIGLACSFFLLHGLSGIREGTVVAAILVGMIVRFFNKHVFWLDRLLERAARPGAMREPLPSAETAAYAPDAPLVISIDREYGSGGHAIGAMIAERLGIQFYDSELVYLTAAQSGLTPDYIRRHEQQLASRFLYELYAQNYAYTAEEQPPEDATFLAQSKVIRDIAAKHACVIVGRCGDYVLRDRKDVLRVFVYAPKEWRLAYGKENNMLQAKDEKGIKDEVEKTDRNRAAYYNYYTQNRWGDAHNYDLAINAALGHDACVQMILAAAEAKEKSMEG